MVGSMSFASTSFTTTIISSDIAGRWAAVEPPRPGMTSLTKMPYKPVRLWSPHVRANRLRAALSHYDG